MIARSALMLNFYKEETNYQPITIGGNIDIFLIHIIIHLKLITISMFSFKELNLILHYIYHQLCHNFEMKEDR